MAGWKEGICRDLRPKIKQEQRLRVRGFLAERFEKVEQVAPGMEFTLEIKGVGEIIWDPSLQFRVSNGEQLPGSVLPWKEA